jgi:hypothetical protein
MPHRDSGRCLGPLDTVFEMLQVQVFRSFG